MPKHINFTGFIAEDEYIELINNSNILMILTTQEYTLTCGAYEGVSIEKPLILSNTETLKDYFYKGAIYSLPQKYDIKKSIILALNEEKQLQQKIIELKKDLEEKWIIRFNDLQKKSRIYN